MSLQHKTALQCAIEKEYYDKFQILKTRLKRKSDSDLARYIIENFIDEYEEKNGVIKTW